MSLAPEMARSVAPGGVTILSGILNTQADEVLAAYRKAGFSLRARDEIGDWTTLVLSRDQSASPHRCLSRGPAGRRPEWSIATCRISTAGWAGSNGPTKPAAALRPTGRSACPITIPGGARRAASACSGVIAIKAAVLATIGPERYEERLVALHAGSSVEQGGAWVLQADPLTVALAERLRAVIY